MMGLIFLVPSRSPFASQEKKHQRLCGETKPNKKLGRDGKTCYAGKYHLFKKERKKERKKNAPGRNLKHLNTLSF